ncbi:pyruvate dehydrogenase E1 component alpha subunit [Desmospora activa DSM 45169]|uniref:Pyruvate dehydrogenase E1 component subunit alpha n=1 Tax=Desmospora activa DSM 45169 TaxID=1121389 RepID=A0A2T4ZD74_9BACL|nr:pyruvate dehydrogenase E1 component alpha subunit [Desmospora activa DSM 45169]
MQQSDQAVQFLQPDGSLSDQGRPVWESLSSEMKRKFYEGMVLARTMDRRSVILQRQGQIGTYAPLEGQEAAQVGSALALAKEDWIFPSYRDHGAAMIAGMPLDRILFYWMGRVEGNIAPKGVRILPPCVPIATQLPQAVGTAWAAKWRGESSVAVAYFGDGATSEGDFHEALNFAGVFRLPCIFFCQNNHYAISVPFSRQSATATVAEKARAYNLPGVRVDGNDVVAVYDVMRKALNRARRGEGATLIEAVTYRKGSHTTADDAKRYRNRDEVKEWERRDPLQRLEKRFLIDGTLTRGQVETCHRRCREEVDKAWKKASQAKKAPPTHLFAHVYQSLPAELKRQRAQVEGEAHG